MRVRIAGLIVLAVLAAGCDVDYFPATVRSAGRHTDGQSTAFRFVKHQFYWDLPAEAWTVVTWPEMEPVDVTVRDIDDDLESVVEVEAPALDLRWYAVRLAPEEAERVESSDGYRLTDGSLVWFHDLGFVAEPETLGVRHTVMGEMLIAFTAPFFAADGGPITGYLSLTQAGTSCDALAEVGTSRQRILVCDGALDFTRPLHLTVREGLITEGNGLPVPPREIDFLANEETGFFRFETAARPFPPVPTELCSQPDYRHICE